MSLEIKLFRVDRVYRLGDVVSGVLVFSSKGQTGYKSITLQMEGKVEMQLSPKTVGVIEAIYGQIKPIKMIDYNISIDKNGKLKDGVSEIPFEFQLNPLTGTELYETYHGVFLHVDYKIRCELIKSSLFSQKILKEQEFIVECPTRAENQFSPMEYKITHSHLQNSKKIDKKFSIDVRLDSVKCDIHRPFSGELVIQECNSPIRSIDLQLTRVETVGCAEACTKESTEIQILQICDGDVCKRIPVPIHMTFPRMFTCKTVASRNFKVEFEVNINVVFSDNHLAAYNIPIELVRLPIKGL